MSQDFWCHLVALRTIFEPLVVADNSGAFRPFLAASMTVEEHGRLFRFTLRPGVTFHDGRPLTSADAKYTLETVVERARRYRGTLSMFHAALLQIQDVRAPDDLTVEVALNRRNHLFPAVLAELAIVPAHLYHKHGLRHARLNRAPVGTGPFRIAPDTADQGRRTRLTLVRNKQYWGRKAGLDRLVFEAIPEPAKALARLRNTRLDLIPRLHPSYYPEQVGGERMRRRFKVLRVHPYTLRILLYNVKQGPLKDRRVRHALAHLVDRQRVLRQVRNSLGQIPAVPVWTLGPWYDKRIHPREYDRAAAARMLAAAGWKVEPRSKLRRRQGYPLVLRLLVSRESPQMQGVAAQLKAEMQAAGGRIEVKVGDFGFIKSQLGRGRFDLALIGVAPRPHSDLSLLLHGKGRLNLGGYANPVADRLLDGIRGTSLEGTRLRLLRQLYRVLHQDPPFLMLYAPIDLMVVSRQITGIAANGTRPVFSSISRMSP